MKLIAQKPCSFGGKKFYIGEEIPAALVLNAEAQAKMGILAIVNDEAGTTQPAEPVEVHNPVDTMTVIVRGEKGEMPLDLTSEGLQTVVDVLTSKAEIAEATIKKMTDEDALILLHVADSRKTIKAAAEARARILNTEESVGEQ